MPYVLQLFGGFRLNRENGEPVSLPERAQALLAYLAVASCPVPRRVLAELLSTEADEQEARTTLRQAVYLARRALADSDAICTQDRGLALNDDLIQCDVHRFRDAVARDSDGSLKEAVQLYRGPFLEGQKPPSPEYEEWLGARRAEFHGQVLNALLKLAASEEAAARRGPGGVLLVACAHNPPHRAPREAGLARTAATVQEWRVLPREWRGGGGAVCGWR